MRLSETIRDIHREGRKNNVSFQDRCNHVSAIIENMANKGRWAGITARREMSQEHFQIGSHHRVSYGVAFIPIDRDGNQIGMECFNTEDHAIAHGYDVLMAG